MGGDEVVDGLDVSGFQIRDDDGPLVCGPRVDEHGASVGELQQFRIALPHVDEVHLERARAGGDRCLGGIVCVRGGAVWRGRRRALRGFACGGRRGLRTFLRGAVRRARVAVCHERGEEQAAAEDDAGDGREDLARERRHLHPALHGRRLGVCGGVLAPDEAGQVPQSHACQDGDGEPDRQGDQGDDDEREEKERAAECSEKA